MLSNVTTTHLPVQFLIPWTNPDVIPALMNENNTYDVINGTRRHGLHDDVMEDYASTIPPQVDILVGIYLLLVQIMSVLFNGIVLGISFWKRKNLKTSDVFVVWLAASDIGHPLTAYPMVISSSFVHRWSYGDLGCQWNGFTSFFFGINSMLTLTMMSLNRYLYITHADLARHNPRVIVTSSLATVFFSSLFWSVAPLLGWGRYGLEPFKTSCTLVWDYPDQSFVTSSFVLVLAIPVLTMFYSYGRIVCLAMKTRHRRSQWTHRPKIFQVWQKKEIRLLKVTVLMSCSFVIFWAPYAIVAMIKSYASHIYLSPMVSLIPCLAAKSSHVADPLIYCFLNKNFSRYIPFLSSGRKSRRTRPPSTHTLQLNHISCLIPEVSKNGRSEL